MNKRSGSSQGGELTTCICPSTATLGHTANLTQSRQSEIRTAKQCALTCCPTDKPISLCPVLSSFPRSPVGEYQLPILCRNLVWNLVPISLFPSQVVNRSNRYIWKGSDTNKQTNEWNISIPEQLPSLKADLRSICHTEIFCPTSSPQLGSWIG